MEQVRNFFNLLIIGISYLLLGGIVGGIIALLIVFIGSWALVLVGIVVAIILILNDE